MRATPRQGVGMDQWGHMAGHQSRGQVAWGPQARLRQGMLAARSGVVGSTVDGALSRWSQWGVGVVEVVAAVVVASVAASVAAAPSSSSVAVGNGVRREDLPLPLWLLLPLLQPPLGRDPPPAAPRGFLRTSVAGGRHASPIKQVARRVAGVGPMQECRQGASAKACPLPRSAAQQR